MDRPLREPLIGRSLHARLPTPEVQGSLGHGPETANGYVDQRRDPAPFCNLEIPKSLLWRGLERCGAARRHRVDAVSFRWRAALVCVFGRLERGGVLRPPGHQAVRRRTAVRLPPLLPARILSTGELSPPDLAVIPPLIVLTIGAGLVWALRGFRS
jgi:hypothetical protein